MEGLFKKRITHWIVLYLIIQSVNCNRQGDWFDWTREAKSNSLTYSKDWGTEERVKRTVYTPSKMSTDQRTLMLDEHNSYRRRERAANMQILVWNEYLADMAQGWAENCKWKHGQPARPLQELPFPVIGQNLYTTWEVPSPNSSHYRRGLAGWYHEKNYYDFNTTTCQHRKMCGHYTQMTWATSREIGCGFHVCSNMSINGKARRNAFYLACNYGPGGNYVGQAPYMKGRSCNSCYSGRNWCNDGLCDESCTSARPECKCKSVCNNCGEVVDCRCRCTDGWHGERCSIKCEDTAMFCQRGWFPQNCNNYKYEDQVRRQCPFMCGLCKKADQIQTKCVTTYQTTVQQSSIELTSTTAEEAGTRGNGRNKTLVTILVTSTTEKMAARGSTSIPTDLPLRDTSGMTTIIPSKATNTPRRTTSSLVATTSTPLQKTPRHPCLSLVCSCQCRCPDEWKGAICTVPRNKANFGMKATLLIDKNKWEMIWYELVDQVVQAVNIFCTEHHGRCCETSKTESRKPEIYPFLSRTDIGLVRGFTVYEGNNKTLVSMYITATNYSSQSCKDAFRNQNSTKTPDAGVPHNILLSAVQASYSRISSHLRQCCDVILVSVENPSQPPEARHPGLPPWVYVLIILTICCVVFLLAITLCYICKREQVRRNSREDLRKHGENKKMSRL